MIAMCYSQVGKPTVPQWDAIARVADLQPEHQHSFNAQVDNGPLTCTTQLARQDDGYSLDPRISEILQVSQCLRYTRVHPVRVEVIDKELSW